MPWICVDLFPERRVRRDRGDTLGDLPADEQHGCTAGLSLAVVHCLSRHCILVLLGCMVVSAVTCHFPTFCIHFLLFIYHYSPSCCFPLKCISEGLIYSPFTRAHRHEPNESKIIQNITAVTIQIERNPKANKLSHRWRA